MKSLLLCLVGIIAPVLSFAAGEKPGPVAYVMIETRDLTQLDAAFTSASTRDEPIEGAHHGVSALVHNFQAALYRDFPDPHRKQGEEKF